MFFFLLLLYLIYDYLFVIIITCPPTENLIKALPGNIGSEVSYTISSLKPILNFCEKKISVRRQIEAFNSLGLIRRPWKHLHLLKKQKKNRGSVTFGRRSSKFFRKNKTKKRAKKKGQKVFPRIKTHRCTIRSELNFFFYLKRIRPPNSITSTARARRFLLNLSSPVPLGMLYKRRVDAFPVLCFE